MFPYFTVEEISAKSGLSVDQVLRLGMAGELIFAILEHLPENYEAISEFINEAGEEIVRTSRTETALKIGVFPRGLQIKYIATEDFINIVTNNAPNRKTLVRSVYETRDIDPKKGKLFFNNPMRVSVEDVVIPAEEWELFSKGKGKNIGKHVPLMLPEKITFPWLWKNLPISMWFKIFAITISIFTTGVMFSKTSFYSYIDSFISDAINKDEKPNN